MGFAVELRKHTKDIHTETETMPFLARYTDQSAHLSDHYLHLVQLHFIYTALTERYHFFQNHPQVQALCEGEILGREDKIKADLDSIESLNLLPQAILAKRNQPLAATQTYVDYIKNIATAHLFLAHFCVRLFGDLFGGQKLKGHVRNIYRRAGATQPATYGTAFYTFERYNASQLTRNFDALKTSTSGTPLSTDEQATLLKDSLLAFEKHQAIFTELETYRSQNQHLFTRQARYFGALNFFPKPNRSCVFATGVIVTAAVVSTALAHSKSFGG